MEVIRSAQNPAIQRARAVGAGREAGFLLLEGERLVAEALRQEWPLEFCLVSLERGAEADELERHGVAVRRVDPSLLGRVSRLVTPPGILAVAAVPAARPISDLNPAIAPLVVVAAGIADPGNLGALARCAEAAGAGGLALLGGASPWNPKALRGSMGSLLRLPVVPAAQAQTLREALAAAGYRQVRAATAGGADFRRFDWTPPVALWLTAETGELPPEAADLEPVTIPMSGPAESLNVTAAAAVLLFAAAPHLGVEAGS